jgi:hypothetical protein
MPWFTPTVETYLDLMEYNLELCRYLCLFFDKPNLFIGLNVIAPTGIASHLGT